jgi:hypothetical protein
VSDELRLNAEKDFASLRLCAFAGKFLWHIPKGPFQVPQFPAKARDAKSLRSSSGIVRDLTANQCQTNLTVSIQGNEICSLPSFNRAIVSIDSQQPRGIC